MTLDNVRPWWRLFVAVVLANFLTGCQNAPLQLVGETMGTSYSIVINDALDERQLTHLQTEVERLLADINQHMSTYIADSELNVFNRVRNNRWHPVSPELAEVVVAAQQVSEQSRGAFDITVTPLVNLWGFGPQNSPAELPSPAVIQRLLEQVGYQYLTVRETLPALKKALPELSIDLSAIAKGYAVDKIAELLRDQKIKNFLVDIGGELRGFGVNAKQSLWRVGIETPDNIMPRTPITVVQLNNQSIATSGDYKNYLEFDGKRYSHEIDPQTGYPVTHNTASVTVIADNTMLADAWATALLVMGSQQGLQLANQLHLAAFFVDRNQKAFTTSHSRAFNTIVVEDD